MPKNMATDITIFFQWVFDHIQSMPHGTLMGRKWCFCQQRLVHGDDNLGEVNPTLLGMVIGLMMV
jgi:hypothetical protein